MPGVKSESPRVPPLDAAQRKKIAEMYRNNYPVTAIQERFGKRVMGQLLKEILDEHNVPHRGTKPTFAWS